MGTKIKWYGRRYNSGLFRYTDKKIEKAANTVKEQAQSRVPVDTGALKSSIVVQKVKELFWRVQSDKQYAKYVEYGTSKRSPHPFFRPALKSLRRF